MSWRPLLERHLSGLARRAGSGPIGTLAQRLERHGPPPPDATGASAARPLLAELLQLTEELQALDEQLVAWRTTLAAARQAGGERRAVEELLPLQSSGRQLAADRAALDRHLDGSALEDRWALREHAVRQQWQFLATVATTQPTTAVHPDVIIAARQAALTLLAESRHGWPLRAGACALLARLDRPDQAGAALARQVLLERATDPQDDAWVQVAALDAWCLLTPEPALATGLLASVLARGHRPDPGLPEHHRFVRGRAAQLAARGRHWALLEDQLGHPDTSEHVRCELVAALTRGAAERPTETRAALDRVLQVEPSRVVQARAVVASLPDGAHPEASNPACWIPLVADALSPSGVPWVAETVLGAVWERFDDGLIPATLAHELHDRWQDGLAHWASLASHPDLAQLASALILRLAVLAVPRTREALAALEAWLAGSAEGDAVTLRDGPVATLSPAELLDVMAVCAVRGMDVSADPLGSGLGARLTLDAPGVGYRIHHGERFATRGWRIAYELRHPRPDKRQAWRHTTDHAPPGRLIAPSGRMAEVTPTAVPGRRGATPTRQWWGQELPLPSQLLAACRTGGVVLRLPSQRITLRPRGNPFLTGLTVQRRYPQLASERARLLQRDLPEAMAGYDAQLGALGLEIERHGPTTTTGAMLLGLDAFLGQILASDTNTIPQLAALAGAWGTYWVGRDLVRAHQARRWRARIPLVVGGWGSRGKSGTERIKAALFHGLGYTVLSKTTGSEAMVVCSIPGGDPVEIYLYRPYDKATIVEQRKVLEIAAGLGVQVMLWECMALNPIYVEILQRDWMKDDITTITNTYPDHEDIQGPSGREVAATIARVIPHGATAITSEQHMTPVLQQQARRHGTAFEVCRTEDWRLLPDDLLERFPYAEHPRNIALALRMAAALEVPRDVALKAMADHVLPDVGVLKEYGPAGYRSRTISFVNGMAANERAGFLSNWERMGFARFERTAGLAEHVVVMINNRADRLPRQSVFAKIAAEDVAADAVVVINTNVGPFSDEFHEALEQQVRPRLLELATGTGSDARERFVAELSRRLRRPPLDAPEARAVLAGTLPGTLPELEQLLASCWGPEARPATLAEGLVAEARERKPDETGLAHARLWLREVSWLRALAAGSDPLEPAVDTAIALLAARLAPQHDPKVTGDQLVDRIASLAPPGSRQRVLGCANIKGAGMGWVYRWLSIQKVRGWLDTIGTGDATGAEAALAAMASHAGYGVADTTMALEGLAKAELAGHLLGLEAELNLLRDRLGTLLEQHRGALGGDAPTDHGQPGRLSTWWQESNDLGDSMARRRESEQLFRDLRARRVGMTRAAQEAKAILGRQKK